MKFSDLEIFDEFVLAENLGVFYVKVPMGANEMGFNAWNSVTNEYWLLGGDVEVTKTGELSSLNDYNTS